jgi:hypothetical protein
MPSVPTTLLERYTLEETIARGGMGTVWKATDEVLARTVAVKVLHPHLSEDEAFVERFRREALAAARLVHPNIVAIYDSGSHEVTDEHVLQHFIVMEYCAGGTLADLLAGRGRLNPDRVVAIGVEVCDALDYAHRNGVVHRDVKPANVLLTHDSMKVADFGIAKAAFATGDITTTGSILGTVTYISPEQAQGKEPDARSDLYALGIVLYELLVGRPPFQEATQMATVMRHVNDPPPAPRSLKAGIPRALEAVLLKTLAKDPDARYASAAEMRNALTSAAAPATMSMRTTGVAAPRTQQEPAAAHGSGGDARWIIGVLAIVAAAVALALLIPALLGEPDDSTNGGAVGRGNSNGGQPLEADEVIDFDPHGDNLEEHPDEVALAVDGDPATGWETEDYHASFELQEKPGVGLRFDFGSPREIAAVELTSSTPSYDVEILAGDEPGDFETDFEQIATQDDVAADDRITFDPAEYRYWLVWITSLPGGGAGSMELSEVRFLAP